MWDPFLTRRNSDRLASTLPHLTLYLGCMIFPWESSEHHTTPATNPPATTTHGPAACPTPLPLSSHTRKLWLKWQNKKKNLHQELCESYHRRGESQNGCSGARRVRVWAHFREEVCVPRKEKIGLASFAYSLPPPRAQAKAFSRGCQMGRWEHLCGQS